MKLVTFSRNDAVSTGILTENGIIDIASVWQGPNPPKSVKEILERGDQCLADLRKIAQKADFYIPLQSVKLLAPIPHPNKIIGLAGNYSEHIKESGLMLGLSESTNKTTVPRPFIMPNTVIKNPEEIIDWPAYSEQIDYEIELAIVIGKKAKYVQPIDAADYIAGYTIANDVSARSTTFAKNRTKRPWDEFYDWLNGKWADGFLPIGPYLVTKDEIENIQNLELELTVNGKVRQKANTRQMIFPVSDIVSFISHLMTLEPGDIIATGTPAGVAAATGDFLKSGDTIECKIDNLGCLKNTLGSRPEKFYEPLTD